MTDASFDQAFPRSDRFSSRHIGPGPDERAAMLDELGIDSLAALTARAIPDAIRTRGTLELPPARGEGEILAELRELEQRNEVWRSYLGLGYADTITPSVILRNVLENPGWYTQYTPYQAEISQGRMEALLNYQTAILDLTGLEVANASLLDEATAAAEAMTMCKRVLGRKAQGKNRYLVAEGVHPQTLAVLRTRAEPQGIEVVVDDPNSVDLSDGFFGILLQYPATDGTIASLQPLCDKAHEHGALVTVAADLLSLTLFKSPGSQGADCVVGNSQRFGVPLGYGGPHAAFMATREDYKRQMPGRIIGITKDAQGRPALRMALQTREQHIRRDKATSNICTAQVLLAVMAGFYAVWHGPEGLRAIANRVRGLTAGLADGLRSTGAAEILTATYFDTIRVKPKTRSVDDVLAEASSRKINLRRFDAETLAISFDEVTEPGDVTDVLACFGVDSCAWSSVPAPEIPADLRRDTDFLTHPVFHEHRSETELLRYINRLQQKDLSLTTSMIPLGSCTMKLNATTEMLPVSWPGFSKLHPFVPREQAAGYGEMFGRLETWLNEITGFAATSLQPNAGSQGEYAGLLTIRAFHRANGQEQRDVCLIPSSAHGTNPASAIMAGMRVVVVACDNEGNIDVQDLEAKADKAGENLAALMVTYPSTHGVFEDTIKDITALIHKHGGQVYLDGANMNALVGTCKPGELGADVCHLNLHKTFCIPHGGGGPGMGPICVASHLAPFLPGHPLVEGVGGEQAIGPVSAAPWGSPSILPISYAYIAMMGSEELTRATEVAILSANYIAKRLEGAFDVLYKGKNGLVAHECILDCRPLKKFGVEVSDIAKRLMDYGFHAPTMSWPVAGTLMIEPTESEPKAELDRFCDAMIAIREEVRAIERGEEDIAHSMLKHAPHTMQVVCGDTWDRAYSRERAAFPAPWTRNHKYWPTVGRVDDAYGDKNLVCACPPLTAYEDDA